MDMGNESAQQLWSWIRWNWDESFRIACWFQSKLKCLSVCCVWFVTTVRRTVLYREVLMQKILHDEVIVAAHPDRGRLIATARITYEGEIFDKCPIGCKAD